MISYRQAETVAGPPARKYSADPPATTAHLLQTAGYEMGHVRRHLDELHAANGARERNFHYEHASGHLDGVKDHLQRLMDHLRGHYPDEAAEMEATAAAGVRSRARTASAPARRRGHLPHVQRPAERGRDLLVPRQRGARLDGEAVGGDLPRRGRNARRRSRGAAAVPR